MEKKTKVFVNFQKLIDKLSLKRPFSIYLHSIVEIKKAFILQSQITLLLHYQEKVSL